MAAIQAKKSAPKIIRNFEPEGTKHLEYSNEDIMCRLNCVQETLLQFNNDPDRVWAAATSNWDDLSLLEKMVYVVIVDTTKKIIKDKSHCQCEYKSRCEQKQPIPKHGDSNPQAKRISRLPVHKKKYGNEQCKNNSKTCEPNETHSEKALKNLKMQMERLSILEKQLYPERQNDLRARSHDHSHSKKQANIRHQSPEKEKRFKSKIPVTTTKRYSSSSSSRSSLVQRMRNNRF